MKSLSYIIIALLFISCQGDRSDDLLSKENIDVSIDFSCDQEETKYLTEGEEKNIDNINIFLFHYSLGLIKHQYLTSPDNITYNLPSGEYEIYTFANLNYDMGENTKTELDNREYSISSEAHLDHKNVIVMCNKQTKQIYNKNSYILIELQRLVARFDININIASNFDFKIHSAQVVDVPATMGYFKENNPSNGISYNPRSSSIFSFYMLENMKGVNYSITKEQDKNSKTAPNKATYLHIIGSCGGVKAEYRVYLGENNTNSFNIKRNSKYTYNITIKGVNEIDSRVSTAVVSFDKVNDSYTVNQSMDTYIRLVCTESQRHDYNLSVSVIQGNGVVKLDGISYVNGGSVLFLQAGQQSASVALSYTQSQPSPVQLRLTVTGNDGISFYRDLFTIYVEEPNKLEIKNITSSDSRGGNPSRILFELLKKEYSGVVKLKYELIKGVGTVKYNNVYFSNGVEVNASIGNNALEFTPTEVQDAELKLTVTLDNGETVSKNVVVKVFRMIIEARTESNANRYGFVFYVDNIPATLNGSTLPINSCREIRISTTVSWICNSCGREVKGGSLVEDRFVQIRPGDQLISRGYWLDTTLHPTVIPILGCGNPYCSSGNLTARLNRNSGSLEVYFPVTKFVTFLNMSTYP